MIDAPTLAAIAGIINGMGILITAIIGVFGLMQSRSNHRSINRGIKQVHDCLDDLKKVVVPGRDKE